MNWLSASSLVVLVGAVVLAVVYWRAYRHNGTPSAGQASLDRANRMRQKAEPLIRENKQHLAENSFTPIWRHALGRGPR